MFTGGEKWGVVVHRDLVNVLLSLTFDELAGSSKAINRNSLKETKILLWKPSVSRVRNTLSNTIDPFLGGSSLINVCPLFCVPAWILPASPLGCFTRMQEQCIILIYIKTQCMKTLDFLEYICKRFHWSNMKWNICRFNFSGLETGYWRTSKFSWSKILCAL